MFGTNLAQCMESAEMAQAVAILIEQWLSEMDDDNHERRLSRMWNAALMEQQGQHIKLHELKHYKEDPRD